MSSCLSAGSTRTPWPAHALCCVVRHPQSGLLMYCTEALYGHRGLQRPVLRPAHLPPAPGEPTLLLCMASEGEAAAL